MPTLLYQAVVIALIAAFIILFIGKTGLRYTLRDYLDAKGARRIAEMLDCTFCLSWWVCFVLFFVAWVFGWVDNPFVPVCATPIVRYLV